MTRAEELASKYETAVREALKDHEPVKQPSGTRFVLECAKCGGSSFQGPGRYYVEGKSVGGVSGDWRCSSCGATALFKMRSLDGET